MQLTLDTYLVVAVLVDLVGLYVIALIVGMRVLRLTMSAAGIFALGSLPYFGAIPWAVRSGRTFWQEFGGCDSLITIIANLALMPITVVVLEAASRTQYPKASAPPDGGPAKMAMGTVIRSCLLQAAR